MASITFWNRLESRTRTDDLGVALEARVHDPLWMMTRQWQFGELKGEDAGSPIQARLRSASGRLTRFHPGPLGDGADERAIDLDDQRLPLEALVERENARQGPELRLRAEGGLHFLRLLEAEGQATRGPGYVSGYGFEDAELAAVREEDDPDGAAFAALVAGRAPDGARLRAALADTLPDELPDDPAIPSSAQAAVRRAARRWAAWWDELVTEPGDVPSSWVPDRLEYAFAVGGEVGGQPVTLSASEYTEGHLDWYSFTVEPAANLGANDEGDADLTEAITRTVIPAPVRYGGMPAPRWWEFEDARVDFGRVDAAPSDLARLLLVEFAVMFGNDWYVIPVDLPVGSVCEVRSLVVTDTFGVRTLIEPSARASDPDEPWQMFRLSASSRRRADRPELLLLPPAIGSSLSGDARERVRLVRDEGANLAWGIESLVTSAAGGTIDRAERARLTGQLTAPAVDAGDAELVYTVMTDVPEHWIPLVPVHQEGSHRDVLLERRSLTRPVEGGGFEAVAPRGRILGEDEDLAIPEEEVPRAGAIVERAYQFARWHGGIAGLWMGRRKRTGRGEASSGLRFDITREADG